MKRLILCLLSLVMILTSVISVNAMTPLQPTEQVRRAFKSYYSKQTDGKGLSLVNVWECADSKEGIFYLVQFVSEDSENKSCFNRFGENDVYYESSDVTNLIFPSGYASCVDKNIYSDSVNFISLDELVKQYSFAAERICEILGREYVGIMGDVDLNGTLSVMDATLIQKHISEIDVLTSDCCKIADIDNDNEATIYDATAIQKRVAEIDG